MNRSIQMLVATALVCSVVSGCKPAGSNGRDTAKVQTPPATATAITPAESIATPAVSATKPAPSTTVPAPAASTKATPKVQTPIKAAPKTTSTATARADAAKIEAARADSIKQVEAKAEAIRLAKADSVKRAEAAKAAAIPEPPVTRAPVAAPAGADQAEDGKAPYEANCRKCHGVRGIPPKTMKEKFPKIATFDAAFFQTHSADSIVTILTKGKNEDMKSFKDKLSHGEMVAVAAYIKSFVH